MRDHKPPVSRDARWSVALAELDRGAFRMAVARLQQDTPDDDAAHRIWRAATLVWLDRLAAARAELEAVLVPRDLWGRAAIVEAECALWEGAPDEAERLAREVAAAVDVTPDDLVRALVMIARTSVRRGEYARAVGRIQVARPLLAEVRLEHLAAVLDNAEGYARAKLGPDDGAGEVLDRAVVAFRRMRDPRWLSIALSTRGGWHDDAGRSAAAARDFAEARRLAEEHGFVREAAWARHNLVQSYLAAGDLDRASDVLSDLMDETRAAEYGANEAAALVSLAFAYVLQGRRQEAARAAGSAAAVAEMAGERHLLADAETIVAYLRARDGEAEGLARLRHYRACAATAAQRHRAALYLADALAPVNPCEAAALWDEAERDEADEANTFAGLTPYVERRLKAYPVRVTEPGLFVVDVRGHNFPARQSTHDALDHFLVKAALAAADTQIGAARLLGEAKGNFNKLVRRYGPDR